MANSGSNRDVAPAKPRPIRWATIHGRWNFDGTSARYHGRSESEHPATPGIAVTNQSLSEGSARVKIRFSEVDAAGDISGGLLLGFQSDTRPYLMAQLGAYGKAYSLAKWVPEVKNPRWEAIEGVGSAQNLEPGRDYQMTLRQTGQEIRMSVDEVPVLRKYLSEPLSGAQLGLFGWGRATIDFSDVTVCSTRPQVFVAMQFGEPFDTLYREVIAPRADDLDLNVMRIDEVAGPGIILEDIKRQIAESKIVIAEITAPNQNVFYELGYAHALNKPTILLAQRGKELPFDIRSYRVIFYDDSIRGKPALEQNLKEHLEAILRDA